MFLLHHADNFAVLTKALFRVPPCEHRPPVQCGSAACTIATRPDSDRRSRSFDDVTQADISVEKEAGKANLVRLAWLLIDCVPFCGFLFHRRASPVTGLIFQANTRTYLTQQSCTNKERGSMCNRRSDSRHEVEDKLHQESDYGQDLSGPAMS